MIKLQRGKKCLSSFPKFKNCRLIKKNTALQKNNLYKLFFARLDNKLVITGHRFVHNGLLVGDNLLVCWQWIIYLPTRDHSFVDNNLLIYLQ
jgi:hypothetical protein